MQTRETRPKINGIEKIEEVQLVRRTMGWELMAFSIVEHFQVEKEIAPKRVER